MQKMTLKRIMKWSFGGILSITMVLFILSWFVTIKNFEERVNTIDPSLLCLDRVNQAAKHVPVTTIFDQSKIIDVDSCGTGSAKKQAFHWTNNEADDITFQIDMDEAGDYLIGIEHLSLTDSIVNHAVTVLVNGKIQSEEMVNMRLLTLWQDESQERRFDIYANQIANRQVPVNKWDYTLLQETLQLSTTPLKFSLDAGKNEITLIKEEGEFLIGDIYFEKPQTLQSYQAYKDTHQGEVTKGQLLLIEAEDSHYKNDVAIRYEGEKSPNAFPYSSNKSYINMVGNYFAKPGQKITYYFNVEEKGLYTLTMKYKNDAMQNVNAFRNIYIDDELLFEELQGYAFPYTSSWKNETLSHNGKPFQLYFEPGIHSLSIEVDASYQKDSYHQIMTILDEISALSLQLKRLTGGTDDKQREWDLDKYLPEAKVQLVKWTSEVEEIIASLKVMNSKKNKSNEIEKKLQSVHKKLKGLRDDHNKLPNKMNLFSEGSNSVAQSLALISEQLLRNPLSLDRIYIHSADKKLPAPRVNPIVRTLAFFQRLVGVVKAENKNEDVLDIWVNRSRFYIELMQQMADDVFTPETGIHVRFSVMPDESKLTLANAAGTQPDLALGVSANLPYTLGLRGAVADLRQFDGFNELITNFAPGALLNLMHDNKVYGLPETQDFNVTFYRKDIFDELGILVPETYTELTKILPTLQRFGMNYYLPLSHESALKGFNATAPFIYQYGGNIYSPDGFKTDLESKETLAAINEMIELYTLYSLPLQTPNFYNHFRNGTLPIGIGSFNTYVQLMFAAPELQNKWNIALSPGVEQTDGTIRRDNVGAAQTVMMFEKSKKQTQGFQFLEWWLSTKTQTDFTYNLQLIYGSEFIWNSANIDAFKTLPISSEHIDVILEQWEQLHNVPNTPGSYIVEREISNVWNKVVFDSEVTRVAIDDSLVIINRELVRKFQEFGYLDSNGKVIKPYILPDIETVKEWQRLGRKESKHASND